MIPWAKDPWNEIIPNLWMGGLYVDPCVPCWPKDEFQLVVSMHPKWDTGPAEGIPHWRCRIPDGVLNADDLDAVVRAEARVIVALNHGEKVLVRCQAGYNRSGLVVALVLLALGYDADEAINLIREKRSSWALCNEHFVKLIKERGAASVATADTTEGDRNA